jgi:ParB family chromosome partitioning protein
VRVRWDEGRGVYVLICGERRWRAARMAGLPTLTCVVAEGTLDAGELLALQLIENCVREDLQPIEQARAYRALMDRTGWSGNRLAQELGIAQSSVVHALALLELPSGIQEKVEQGELSPSTAYEISKAPDVESQVEVAARVVAEGLTRSEAIEAVRQAAGRRLSRKTVKGRGAKARKITVRTFRTSAGYKITIENRRGIEPASLAAALRETFDRVEAEIRDDEADGAAA